MLEISTPMMMLFGVALLAWVISMILDAMGQSRFGPLVGLLAIVGSLSTVLLPQIRAAFAAFSQTFGLSFPW